MRITVNAHAALGIELLVDTLRSIVFEDDLLVVLMLDNEDPFFEVVEKLNVALEGQLCLKVDVANPPEH